MVAKQQANRLRAQRGSFDDDFAANQRVGDAPLDIADDAALQHNRVLDLAARKLAIWTDRRKWADVCITHRSARSNHSGPAYGAGRNRGPHFNDDWPDQRRIRVNLPIDPALQRTQD